MNPIINKILKLIIIIVLVIGVFSTIGYFWFKESSKTYEGEIEIFKGANVKQTADVLELEGVIDNANIFYFYIKGKEFFYSVNPFTTKTFDVSFKAGNFKLKPGDFDSLIDQLNEFQNVKKPNSSTSVLTTIPEGFTINQIAKKFEEDNIVNYDSFMQIVDDSTFYKALKEDFKWLPDENTDVLHKLEGYLHANTYDFSGGNVNSIVTSMIKETDKWFKEHRAEIEDNELSFVELVTLASIVEKESKFSEDRPKVAQVFLNRLSKGMKLQSDITSLYALGVHKTKVTYDDIAVESPYNTYYANGLPPGPINSPSYESFLAVLHPEGKEFDKLFFYARPSGETFYTNTLEEHQQIINKYKSEWDELN